MDEYKSEYDKKWDRQKRIRESNEAYQEGT